MHLLAVTKALADEGCVALFSFTRYEQRDSFHHPLHPVSLPVPLLVVINMLVDKGYLVLFSFTRHELSASLPLSSLALYVPPSTPMRSA